VTEPPIPFLTLHHVHRRLLGGSHSLPPLSLLFGHNSEAAYVLFSLEVDAFVQNLTKNKGAAMRRVANLEMEGFEQEIDRISEAVLLPP
jgi:hypothetical protein